MSAASTETLTFLLTDVEGSTALSEQHPEAMRTALARHRGIVADAVASRAGHLVRARLEGDGTFSAFRSAADAIAAALEIQTTLHAAVWPGGATVRLRAAVHTGEATAAGDDYESPAINRCARLRALARGGQTLLSGATHDLIRDRLPAGATLSFLGSYRLRDLSQPERVYQLNAPGLPREFPAIPASPAGASILPTPPTPLVGRECELADLDARLKDPAVRLITITGAGGVGKTRLATQAASNAAAAFEDGVAVVSLGALAEADQVPAQLAHALDVREEPGRPLPETLVDHLAGKSVLLLLDNFEHVLDATVLVARLLSGAPSLKVLATSREPLRLRGEHVWPLEPLGLPGGRDHRLTEIELAPSVQLFVRLAVAADPRFLLTDENAAAVSEICRRLDGLPLALELAASRVRVLPPRALLARIRKRLPLPREGIRDLPERQRTLHDLIAWSHDLLDESQQRLFACLAVFVGGLSLESAEDICAEFTDDVFAGIADLTDRSLLRVTDAEGDAPRFSMLETVREFARERLSTGGMEPLVRRRHARHFLALAREAESRVRGTEAQVWLDRIETEHGNLLSAIESGIQETDLREDALRVTAGLWYFWYVRGYLGEGRRWLDRALQPENEAPDDVRAALLNSAGILAGAQADHAAAQRFHEEGLEIHTRRGDSTGIGTALSNLGLLARAEGDYTRAREMFARGVALFRETGAGRPLASALINLGGTALDSGDLDGARRIFQESLPLLRQYADRLNEAAVLNNLGEIARRQGDQTLAATYLRQSLEMKRLTRDQLGLVRSLESLALLLLQRGSAAECVRLIAAARSGLAALGAALSPADAALIEPHLVNAREALAKDQFDAAWREGERRPLEETTDDILARWTKLIAPE